jgi:penicillin-binding protein 2
MRRPSRGGAGAGGGGWAPNLTPKIAVRIAIIGGIAVALLGLLLVRLWFLQVINAEGYADRAEENRLRSVVSPAPRGNVVDRDGAALIGHREAQNVVARPRDLVGRRREQVLGRLATKLGVPAAVLMERMEAGESRPFESVVLARNVDQELSFYLAQRKRQFPGVGLETTYLRTYPQGDLAAHVLGSTGPIAPDQLERFRERGYEGNETVGQGGVEQQYEQFLHGTPGRRVVEVDAAGELRGREVVSSVAPKPGRDLQLTIDVETQRALEEAIVEQIRGSATGGAGVALDPRTGEVLALASFPDYDPSVFVTRKAREIEALTTNELNPLLNRAIGGAYPAGSTFKAITATAALDNGIVGPDDLVDSPAELTLYKTVFPNFEHHSHGQIPMRTALELSSDTYFYQLGDEFWQATGSPLQDEAVKFGMGRQTGIDLPGELSGRVPTPAWKRRHFAGAPFTDLDRSWKPGDTINLSVGQGYLEATPLQLAVAYAAIANGGVVHSPTIGRRVLDPNGRVVRELSEGRPTSELGASSDALGVVREGLYLAANGFNGTSTPVFGGLPEGDKVAGKTGTAEQPQGEDHSWFVGYAPYDDPQIVVAVIIEAGGTGASAAAPAVCETMAANLPFDPELCGTGAVAN